MNKIKNPEEFTFMDAYAMQLRDIAEWSKRLNTEAYLLLLNEVIKRNDEGYKSPYDVCRGNDITFIILNIKF
jgi:hypothetical protein